MDEIISRDEVRFHLAKLGAYFAIKIRDNKENPTYIELYQSLNKIRDYINKEEIDLDDRK